jgi:hypothetical protein
MRILASLGVIGYLWFVAVSGFWLMSVATASPQEVDAKAAQAINKITEAGTNAIIDEVKSQPIKIIGDALTK